jgi:flagellar assembly protein FliH
MFLYNTQWAKLELKGIGSDVMGARMAQSEDLESEFIPLAGEGRGLLSGREVVERILRQAEEKAAHLEREAYDKGFAQGEKDGFELGRKKAEKIVSDIARLFKELSGLKRTLTTSHEREILDVVLAIAGKVVHHQIIRDESIIRSAVRSALQLTADRSEIAVRLNPEDVGLVEKAKPEFFAEFKDLRGFSVMPDASISRGGCVVESPYGDVDGRIETQMEEIHRILDEAFSRQDA